MTCVFEGANARLPPSILYNSSFMMGRQPAAGDRRGVSIKIKVGCRDVARGEASHWKRRIGSVAFSAQAAPSGTSQTCLGILPAVSDSGREGFVGSPSLERDQVVIGRR